jgi:hypothetical protein
MVLAKGDETAGAILIVTMEKGAFTGLSERILDMSGRYTWANVGPQTTEKQEEIDEYLARRRRGDPDLWLIELDIAGAAQFAAQMTFTG